MSETISFKVWLKNSVEKADSDVRRFTMDQEPSRIFSSLSEKLCSIYPVLSTKIFSVTWTDDDNDSVTISTDDELSIALTEMTGSVYKLHVQVKGDKENTGRNIKGDVHPGVMCDGCEKAVEGFRYKCLVCQDFDLCGVCENAGLHPEHNMIRIARPGQKFFPNMGQHLPGGHRNSCRRPWHVPMPGFFGFLEGLEKAAGDQGKGRTCPRRSGEKSCKSGKDNTTKVEENQTKPSKEVGKENEENNQENKKNDPKKSPTEEMINNFIGAAVGCLGEDVQVPTKDIENVGKLVSNIVSMFNIEMDTQERKNEPEDKTTEQELPTEATHDVEPEKEKAATAISDKEEWTIVKDESNKSPSTNMYPSLDEVSPPSSSDAPSSSTKALPPTANPSFSPSTASTTMTTNTSVSSSPASTTITTNTSVPSSPAVVTDPNILVALQAMTNMGFNNEGGWLQNLLETKGGDIGKVLDVLKPSKQ